MRSKLKSFLGQMLVNNLGWKTNKKIIVFESDDWGGISMPSRKVYNKLLRKGIKVDQDPYLKFDSLASEDDLNALFSLTNSFKDKNGNPPIIGFNTNTGNPDFEAIKKDNFKKYHFEPFTVTLQRYPNHSGSFKLWNEAIENNLMLPFYHGREHLNPLFWLEELTSQNPELNLAFDLGLNKLPKSYYNSKSGILNSAFYPRNQKEYDFMMDSLIEGLNQFENIFNMPAQSFIATGYFWNRKIEPELAKRGIQSIQGLPVQKEPLKNGKLNKILNYTGKRNAFEQIYLVRNAFFEPSLINKDNQVGECLKRIEKSFKNNKPAIISSHRLNFIGSIEISNRESNLKQFDLLLKGILKNWPDVEFMSSAQLTHLIKNTKQIW
jgi:hypothetical protein